MLNTVDNTKVALDVSNWWIEFSNGMWDWKGLSKTAIKCIVQDKQDYVHI